MMFVICCFQQCSNAADFVLVPENSLCFLAEFSEWPEVMTTWGNKMLAAVHTVSQMAAIGFGLPAGAFTDRMANGPHLLAPTGDPQSNVCLLSAMSTAAWTVAGRKIVVGSSCGFLCYQSLMTSLCLTAMFDCTGADLDRHNTLDMCYAGYHYDLNFLTIHGKSRFPGLFVWLRDGRRVAVKIPAGCLFIQAGKQLEWLTGGYVMAGMYEVSFIWALFGRISSMNASLYGQARAVSSPWTLCTV